MNIFTMKDEEFLDPMQWQSKINLKFCLLNAENLFLLFDQPLPQDFQKLTEAQWQKLSTSVYENKALRKTQEIAKALHEINADIIMLCEVGGVESLKNFNQYFLNDEYSVCLLEGNSNRNIDVGFLIKKTAIFYFDLLSNKNRPINFVYPHEVSGKVASHKFSRDVAELRLFAKDKEKPFLIILLTHLKSRLDPDRVDPNGFERRLAEMRTLVEIYSELSGRYPHVPMMVAGDMNGNASATDTDEEFKTIYSQTDLQDVLEVNSVSAPDRATFYQVRNGGKADGRQIDFAFLSEHLKKHLKANSAYVYRYKDHLGMAHDTPTSLDAKLLLPADHYPVVFEIEKLPC
jgi:endonuclease/exonuclease/phosphatase family metal-dependent hydrolase